MPIPADVLATYGKILERAYRGGSDAEKATARQLAEKRQRKYPGIHEAYLTALAAAEAKVHTQRHVEQMKAQAKAQAKSAGLFAFFDRFTDPLADLVFGRLQAALEDQIDHIAREGELALRGNPMPKPSRRKSEEEEPEIEAIDYSATPLRELLEDPDLVEYDVEEDDVELEDGSEDSEIHGDITLSGSLADYIVDDPDRCEIFARWFLGREREEPVEEPKRRRK